MSVVEPSAFPNERQDAGVWVRDFWDRPVSESLPGHSLGHSRGRDLPST